MLTTFGRLAQDQKIDRNELIQHCLSGKAIHEFQRNQESLSDATNAHGKAADSKATTSPGANVTEQSGANEQHSIMEQIKECNEDMKQTHAMISGLIAKPNCSDKLLAKPPFRFIHDLIIAIGKATQFDLGQIFR